MHKAILSALRPMTREALHDPRPVLRGRLSSIPVGRSMIINGWPVWRCGADLFAINGEAGTHDILSAASVISGHGNPLPEAN